MADDTRKFYENVDANVRGINHQDSRPEGSDQKTRPNYKREPPNPHLVKTPNHTFKAVSGSRHFAERKPGYVKVGYNSLNIMDYANHMGWPFTRTNEPGVQYRLGVSDPKQEAPHTGKGDLTSISVGLNPQPFYINVKGKDGKSQRLEARDENGKKIKVTGKGGFSRFSEKMDYGQGNAGDSMIRIIMNTQGMDNQRDAYQFLENMRRDYGDKTRFDPLDPDLPLPERAEGRVITYQDGSRKTRSPKGEVWNGDPDEDILTTNPYLETAQLAHDNLKHPEIGGDALKELHQSGYDDDTIRRKRIGWLPGKNDPNHDQITRYFDRSDNRAYGMGIHSRLSMLDQNGDTHDRFGGQFIYPEVKHGQVIGINAFDKDRGIDSPIQHVSNEKLTHYERHHSTSPYGNHKNGPETGENAYDDTPSKQQSNSTESGRQFAQGYFRKRGISPSLVNHMMDRDLMRVYLGQKGDFDSLKELNQRQQSYNDLKDHRDDYLKQGYNGRDYNNELVRRRSKANDKELNNKAADKNAYIEFSYKLPDEDTKDRYADMQKNVGAERIEFKPGTKDFKPVKKGTQPHSMKNYGFNMTLGNDTSSKERSLYIFKSPTDAMSYMDLHRQQILNSGQPIDVLSLGGTAGKSKTISNFIHNRLDVSDGQRYNRIVFGTDNNEPGQSLVAHYTETARHHMPQDRANDLFHVQNSPYGKDWNDTSQLLARADDTQKHKLSDRLNYQRPTHRLDQYMDHVARNYYSHMTKDGRKWEKEVNDKMKPLYVAYENKGEKARTTQDKKAVQAFDKSRGELESHNHDSYQIHQAFEKNGKGIGGTMSPFEKDRTLRAMVDEDHQDNMQRSQDVQANNRVAHHNQPDVDTQPKPRVHRATKEGLRKRLNDYRTSRNEQQAKSRARHRSETSLGNGQKQSTQNRRGPERGIDNRGPSNRAQMR